MKIKNLLLISLWLAVSIIMAGAQNTITVKADIPPGKEIVELNEKEEPEIPDVIEKERSYFQKLLIENPNYFGNEPDSPLLPVTIMKVNTRYEELMKIAFLPEKDLLEGFINIKLPYGFAGALCAAGSYEYVRFFADWNNDGDYDDENEDLGLTSVNVHDIPNIPASCLSTTKPLTYTVPLKITSPKYVCNKEHLVKVRAILSWERIPPANTPLYVPVWGNVMDAWIQIKPVLFLPLDIIKDKIELYEFDKFSSMYYKDLSLKEAPELRPDELKALYADKKDVTVLRYDLMTLYPKLQPYMEKIVIDDQVPEPDPDYIEPKLKEIVAKVYPELYLDPHRKYEQLNAVGLQYNLDTLSASLSIKLPYGYNGNLCSQGSYEYVAFWLYVWDNEKQMCSWHYAGTSRVNVHDIRNIPRQGLEYAVNLQTDLSSLKKECKEPVILKVRGILSWGNPPPANNPYYIPLWGNRKDAIIQLKPGNYGLGRQVPFISMVGGMAVERISGNSPTAGSVFGDGYANGVSVTGGYNAIESPFGGLITIAGYISNPPDDPASFNKIVYKVQYKKAGETGWNDITNKFLIWINTCNGSAWSMNSLYQTATNGYYTYEEDPTAPVQRFVEGNVLAQWRTPMPEGDGLYEVRILVKDPSAPLQADVPAGHSVSNLVKIMVDNSKPDAQISLRAGDCTKFYTGDVIRGQFDALDRHIWKYTLSTLPYGNPPVIIPGSGSYPALNPPGIANGSFTIYTTTTPSCGYVARLYVWDRTIINNYLQGNQNTASVGFCLLD